MYTTQISNTSRLTPALVLYYFQWAPIEYPHIAIDLYLCNMNQAKIGYCRSAAGDETIGMANSPRGEHSVLDEQTTGVRLIIDDVVGL